VRCLEPERAMTEPAARGGLCNLVKGGLRKNKATTSAHNTYIYIYIYKMLCIARIKASRAEL